MGLDGFWKGLERERFELEESQTEFAKRLGITQGYYSAARRNAQSFSMKLARRILRTYPHLVVFFLTDVIGLPTTVLHRQLCAWCDEQRLAREAAERGEGEAA